MNARQLSIAFAEHFCAGDVDGLAALLAQRLRLRGPLYTFDSREAYLRSLRADPPEPAPCHIEMVLGVDDEAALLYEWARPGTPVRIAQFSRARGGKLSDVRLVF